MSLKGAQQKATNYFLENIDTYGCSESDKSINDISREIIAEMKNTFGQCWLGKINRYPSDKNKPCLIEYTGQLVYNFEYCFAIPAYDQNIIDLINARELTEYDNAKDYLLISEISEKIAAIDGVLLSWA